MKKTMHRGSAAHLLPARPGPRGQPGRAPKKTPQICNCSARFCRARRVSEGLRPSLTRRALRLEAELPSAHPSVYSMDETVEADAEDGDAPQRASAPIWNYRLRRHVSAG